MRLINIDANFPKKKKVSQIQQCGLFSKPISKWKDKLQREDMYATCSPDKVNSTLAESWASDLSGESTGKET